MTKPTGNNETNYYGSLPRTLPSGDTPPPPPPPAVAAGDRCADRSEHGGRGEPAARDGCQGRLPISTCDKAPTLWGRGRRLPSGLAPPPAPPRPLLGRLGRGPGPPRGWEWGPRSWGQRKFQRDQNGLPDHSLRSTREQRRPGAAKQRTPAHCSPGGCSALGRIKGTARNPTPRRTRGQRPGGRGGSQRLALGKPGQFCLNRLETTRLRPAPHCPPRDLLDSARGYAGAQRRWEAPGR